MRFFVHIRKNYSFFLLSLLSLKSANGWLTANCNKSFSDITGDSSDSINSETFSYVNNLNGDCPCNFLIIMVKTNPKANNTVVHHCSKTTCLRQFLLHEWGL